jgi:23S rRNA pseudouridine1911/1915/1917 synthase
VVEGHPAPPEGVIDQPLYEDKNLLVRVGSHPMAKDARTRYRTRETGVKRALLEIHLETGRRHQIRAHLAWLGHPVVGDARYGQPDSRMALHAQRLSFQHPVTHERVLLETPPPALFSKLLRQPS